MRGMGYRNNSELTDRQLQQLRGLLSATIGVMPLDGHHSRTLRSLVRKGFAKRGEHGSGARNRYFITDEGVARLGPSPWNATRSRTGGP